MKRHLSTKGARHELMTLQSIKGMKDCLSEHVASGGSESLWVGRQNPRIYINTTRHESTISDLAGERTCNNIIIT